MDRPGDVKAAIWLWQAIKSVCHYLFIEDVKHVSSIDVPVRLVIETDLLESDLVAVLTRHGSLSVTVCPVCFSLVPGSKVEKHAAVMGHE